MIEINLLPGGERRSKRRGGSSPLSTAVAGINRQLSDRFLIGAVAAAVVSLAAIAGMFLYQSHQASVLNDREMDAARDSARFSAVLLARKHSEMTRDSVYQQLAIIKSIDDSRYVWPHILEEINMALPPYTWLTSIEQTSALQTAASPNSGDTTAAGKAKADSAKKQQAPTDPATAARRNRLHADSLLNGNASATAFRIIGQTVDIQALTRFMTTLEASPFIRNVQLTRSNLITAGNQSVTEFQLEAETQVPSSSVIHTIPLSIAVH
ncbi:MAG TPA: PilN domain-containing protein [Gemmatimonadaceae bacterium]|jgi:Tfp pilus assembly protein PilN|nr:PilN domain-containing protein [Gemmatimonadaceae bacterium]